MRILRILYQKAKCVPSWNECFRLMLELMRIALETLRNAVRQTAHKYFTFQASRCMHNAHEGVPVFVTPSSIRKKKHRKVVMSAVGVIESFNLRKFFAFFAQTSIEILNNFQLENSIQFSSRADEHVKRN